MILDWILNHIVDILVVSGLLYLSYWVYVNWEIFKIKPLKKK